MLVSMYHYFGDLLKNDLFVNDGVRVRQKHTLQSVGVKVASFGLSAGSLVEDFLKDIEVY